jgi:hypothetical protein
MSGLSLRTIEGGNGVAADVRQRRPVARRGQALANLIFTGRAFAWLLAAKGYRVFAIAVSRASLG